MANTPRDGSEATYVQPRHGEAGYVVLRVEVTPDTKDLLVYRAAQEGVTIKALVNRIFEEHFA